MYRVSIIRIIDTSLYLMVTKICLLPILFNVTGTFITNQSFTYLFSSANDIDSIYSFLAITYPSQRKLLPSLKCQRSSLTLNDFISSLVTEHQPKLSITRSWKKEGLHFHMKKTMARSPSAYIILPSTALNMQQIQFITFPVVVFIPILLHPHPQGCIQQGLSQPEKKAVQSAVCLAKLFTSKKKTAKHNKEPTRLCK